MPDDSEVRCVCGPSRGISGLRSRHGAGLIACATHTCTPGHATLEKKGGNICRATLLGGAEACLIIEAAEAACSPLSRRRSRPSLHNLCKHLFEVLDKYTVSSTMAPSCSGRGGRAASGAHTARASPAPGFLPHMSTHTLIIFLVLCGHVVLGTPSRDGTRSCWHALRAALLAGATSFYKSVWCTSIGR